ncbi:cyclase [Halorussus salilacus]|uniref:SRPBCC family protein n=1 Tax=Halorussus salilacus TaxID=2953750 RepID=UPI00209EC972|nr:SRPBCC family protein [Halorussus salilacus]USZ68636.1 cyclase [Halorussus salilacus]
MATYRRAVRVDAPLEAVWEFHSRIEGLRALTPDWMNLRVEAVRGPDGSDRTAETDHTLAAGTEIDLSVRPFGVGPRQRWTSRITRRDRGDGSAVFEDVMDDGPFPRWRHVHGFYADGEGTLVRDRVTYDLPVVGSVPVVGDLLGPLGWLGFEPMFRDRHRRTRQILE